MRNKAQFGTLQTVILTLVIIGILLGIGFLVLEELRDTMKDSKTTTVRNETWTPLTDSVVHPFVDYNSTTLGFLNCYSAMSIIGIENVSGAILLSSGNYTIVAATGGLTNNTWQDVTTVWNVSYTYTHGGQSCAGVQDTIEAEAEIPSWLAIIVILLIVGILLAIVFKVLPTGGGGVSFGRGSEGTVAEI